jgi:hypothetical protein
MPSSKAAATLRHRHGRCPYPRTIISIRLGVYICIAQPFCPAYSILRSPDDSVNTVLPHIDAVVQQSIQRWPMYDGVNELECGIKYHGPTISHPRLKTNCVKPTYYSNLVTTVSERTYLDCINFARLKICTASAVQPQPRRQQPRPSRLVLFGTHQPPNVHTLHLRRYLCPPL